MSNYAISLKRTSLLLAALAFTAALLVANLSIFSLQADAAQLASRSLNVTSTMPGDETGTGVANDETNGSNVTYTFVFTPTTASIGGVIFKVCTTAVGTCIAPSTAGGSGRMFESATSSSNNLAGTWAIDNTGLTAEDAACVGTDGLENCIAVSTGTPTAQAGTARTLAFSVVENPDVLGTFFVRITTYTANDFNTAVDDGTVANSVTEGIYITSRVAETLGFSTTGDFSGGTLPAEGAACAALTGSGAIVLGDPTENTLSIASAYDNYTAFRIYSNATNGVDVYYDGNTLTKVGGQTITPIASDFDSATGTEQFGLGIDTLAGDDGDDSITVASRTLPISVANIDPSTELTGGDPGEMTAAAGYDNADGSIVDGGVAEFGFTADTPTLVASSASYITCNTAAVRYIANIAPTTEAGTYTTTIVYIAVPEY